MKIEFTKIAAEKYELLVNGIRKSINAFFDSLSSDDFDLHSLRKLEKTRDETTTFYSKECKSMYIILVKTKKEIIIVDLLTPEEYNKFFG